MEVAHRYAGASGATRREGKETLSFSPDLLREPTFFVGRVSRHVAFREAISTLHHVVTSDLRFKPRDRTEYFAWLEGQRENWLAEAAARAGDVNARLGALRAELHELDARARATLRPFHTARAKYWKWLYTADRDAWFVLDPVIAVSPDEVSFECFSIDESTYGRFSCDLEMFDDVDEVANGVTNVDYSHALYDAFQQVRSYRRTELRIEPGGFTASTTAGQEVFEQKIDLPDSWVRGFLQVSAAMTLPATRVTLHPMDVHNLCFALRSRMERHGPRSLRFVLGANGSVDMVFEPWERRIACPRAVHDGDKGLEVRVWGRRRLLILERLIPIARSFDLHLLGNGLPLFVVVDLGPMTFTLGLSGWTANDWSRAGQFDLLAPRRQVSTDSREKVLAALASRWLADTGELVTATGLERGEVASALTLLAQHGRVMRDLDKRLWRYREVLHEPLDIDTLRFASEEEARADRLIVAGRVVVDRREARLAEGLVEDGEQSLRVRIELDDDERLVGANCECARHRREGLRKGPCEHVLALRRALGDGA